MTTMYENEETRQNELRFQKWLLDEHGLVSHKMPAKYGLDFLVFDGDTPIWWVEFKKLNIRFATFDELFISFHKVMSARRLNDLYGIQCWWYVRGLDDARRVDLLGNAFRLSWGGRNNRGDENDMEPIANYKTEWFEGVT